MKKILILVFATLNSIGFSQGKFGYGLYNKLTEIKGTEYIVAAVENYGKGIFAVGEHLLFINSTNGETKQTDFPSDAQVLKIEQIKIDSFKINCVLVAAKTVNIDGNSSIGWKDPEQVFIYSPNGQKLAQLTDNNFDSRTWVVNHTSATIAITGYFDLNKNGTFEKTEKNEILIFDLKTYKLIAKI